MKIKKVMKMQLIDLEARDLKIKVENEWRA